VLEFGIPVKNHENIDNEGYLLYNNKDTPAKGGEDQALLLSLPFQNYDPAGSAHSGTVSGIRKFNLVLFL
jgi:hypothetical protein